MKIGAEWTHLRSCQTCNSTLCCDDLPNQHARAIGHPVIASAADALGRLVRADIGLEAASDHGVSEAIYLRDPDDNGAELYRDRPPEQGRATPRDR